MFSYWLQEVVARLSASVQELGSQHHDLDGQVAHRVRTSLLLNTACETGWIGEAVPFVCAYLHTRIGFMLAQRSCSRRKS